MNHSVIKCLLIIFTITITISCNKAEISKNSSTKDKSKSLTKPEVKVTSHYANGSYDGWYVIGTVTTGGDEPTNVSCTLEWAKFAKKQSGTVKLTNKSTMIGVNYSNKRVQFKKNTQV